MSTPSGSNNSNEGLVGERDVQGVSSESCHTAATFTPRATVDML